MAPAIASFATSTVARAAEARVRRLLDYFGFEVSKTRRGIFSSLFLDAKVDHIIDVGANRGQFLSSMRAAGYSGPATAFEPLIELHEHIRAAGNVEVYATAIGASRTSIEMTVYSDSDFSSFYSINSRYTRDYRNAPTAKELRRVEVLPLDDFSIAASSALLKIDTQGADANVLRGATETLKKVKVIQLKLPFLQIYDGGCSAGELFELTQRAGFYPGRFFANSITHWGGWVDGDVLFFRRPD